MAKKEAVDTKTNSYLLGIVGIVAIVGLVILVLNSGGGSLSVSSDDVSGQAIRLGPRSVVTMPNSIWRNIGSGTLDAAETQPCQCGQEICMDSSTRCTNCEATYGTDCTPL